MTLDPQLLELRRSLGRFRRRALAAPHRPRRQPDRRRRRRRSQLGLAVVARLMPFEWHALTAAVIARRRGRAAHRRRPRPAHARRGRARGRLGGRPARPRLDRPFAGDRVARSGRRGHRQPTPRHELRSGAVRAPGPPAAARRARTRSPAPTRAACASRLPRRQSATAALRRAAAGARRCCCPTPRTTCSPSASGMRDAARAQAQRLEETASRAGDRPRPRPIRASTWPRSCAGWRASCAIGPRISTGQLARLGSLEDALRSHASIRPTSSAPRRSPRSRVRSAAPRPAATATRRVIPQQTAARSRRDSRTACRR